ncbi:CrcB family protein [Nitriliruptoraceae bacterium ZYF776]|nr:CrcB family protein [Profundirhabdus halotolerans]
MDAATTPTARRRPPRRSVPAAVAVGGAAGALTRYGVVALVAAFAGDLLGVLLVNLAGTFALGWMVGRAGRSSVWRTRLPLLGAGFCGSLTTFSTVALQLADPDRGWAAATVLVVVNLVLGVLVAVVGLRLGAGQPVHWPSTWTWRRPAVADGTERAPVDPEVGR